MKVAIITTDGTLTVTEMGDDLTDIYKAIGNGCEMFQMLMIGDGVLLVDEEAKVKAVPPPTNLIATIVCEEFDVGLDPTDAIWGNMVLAGLKDGELVDIPESLLTGVRAYLDGEFGA